MTRRWQVFVLATGLTGLGCMLHSPLAAQERVSGAVVAQGSPTAAGLAQGAATVASSAPVPAATQGDVEGSAASANTDPSDAASGSEPTAPSSGEQPDGTGAAAAGTDSSDGAVGAGAYAAGVEQAAGDEGGAGGEDYGLSAAELAELGLGTSEAGEAPVDTSLKLYGFIDYSFSAVVGSKEWSNVYEPHPTFGIGNFNLYMSKNLSDSIRMFAEVRLLYLPNGGIDQRTGTLFSTASPDYNESLQPLHWGGVEIERVYLEWRIFSALSLRAGQFLTPYGIWNVDHGSPTVIPVHRPFVIQEGFFPERQTGLELFGQVALSANHTLGYHLTLSNGLGPATEYRDLDNNKAIGGRLFWAYDGLGQFKIGGSAFYGRDTSAQYAIGLTQQGRLNYAEQVLSQSDVLSLALDVQWRYAGLLVQGEYVSQQRKFTDRGRAGFTHPLLGEYVAPKDNSSHGSYLLIGYRFDFFGTMPFAILSDLNFDDPVQFTHAKAVGIGGGLNLRPLDGLVIKLEYDATIWPDGYIVSDKPIQLLSTQLAWAF